MGKSSGWKTLWFIINFKRQKNERLVTEWLFTAAIMYVITGTNLFSNIKSNYKWI